MALTRLRMEIWLQVSKPRHTRPAVMPISGPTLGTSITARSAGGERGSKAGKEDEHTGVQQRNTRLGKARR